MKKQKPLSNYEEYTYTKFPLLEKNSKNLHLARNVKRVFLVLAEKAPKTEEKRKFWADTEIYMIFLKLYIEKVGVRRRKKKDFFYLYDETMVS